jgi:alkanesulfonate monooxygenase
VIVGGGGKRRTPALGARFAAEFNVPFMPIDGAVAQFERVDAACREIGRDPGGLVRSVAHPVCVGRDDAEVARRAAAMGRKVEDIAALPTAGTPAHVVDEIGTWRERTGATRFYLQVLDLADLGHVELVAAEVAPRL